MSNLTLLTGPELADLVERDGDEAAYDEALRRLRDDDGRLYQRNLERERDALRTRVAELELVLSGADTDGANEWLELLHQDAEARGDGEGHAWAIKNELEFAEYRLQDRDRRIAELTGLADDAVRNAPVAMFTITEKQAELFRQAQAVAAEVDVDQRVFEERDSARATLDHIEQLLGVADSDEEGAGLVALRAVIEERDELAVTLASLREDYLEMDARGKNRADDFKLAAGALRIVLPEPGSDTARLLSANILLRRSVSGRLTLKAKCDAQRKELHALNVAIRERDRLTDERIANLVKERDALLVVHRAAKAFCEAPNFDDADGAHKGKGGVSC